MALTTGLTAYYKLEDLTESVGGLTLTDHNGVTFSTGKVGNAGNFVQTPPNPHYLSRADNAAFQIGTGDNLTLACWVKRGTLSGTRGICGYGQPFSTNGYCFYIASNVTRWEAYDGTGYKDLVMSGGDDDNNWHFYVGTLDRNGSFTCYRDNVQEATDTGTVFDLALSNSTGFLIGTAGADSFTMDGMVDEVGIWNRVLSGSEITELWNGGAGKTYPFTVTVTVNLTGVAADPQIGSGTVTIGSASVTPPTEDLVPGRWFGLPEKEKVYLTGVAANPQVGEIAPRAKVTREELERVYPFPKREEERPLTRLGARKKAPPKPDAFVYVTGVHPVPRVGSVTAKAFYEDNDEELTSMLKMMDVDEDMISALKMAK